MLAERGNGYHPKTERLKMPNNTTLCYDNNIIYFFPVAISSNALNTGTALFSN